MTATWVPVAGGTLAASAEVAGDAVLVVQTALSVDELVRCTRNAGAGEGRDA